MKWKLCGFTHCADEEQQTGCRQRGQIEPEEIETCVFQARGIIEQRIELHRTELERHSGVSLDPVMWKRGYVLALMDMLVNRLPMYMMAHTFRHYEFMERVYRTFRAMLDIEQVGQPGVKP